jgi:hypothetical protein
MFDGEEDIWFKQWSEGEKVDCFLPNAGWRTGEIAKKAGDMVKCVYQDGSYPRSIWLSLDSDNLAWPKSMYKNDRQKLYAFLQDLYVRFLIHER